MKSKILFITLAIVFSSLGFASAQKEKKEYSFVYAKYTKSYDRKIVYISEIVSGKCKYLSSASGYECPQRATLSIQWNAKFKTIVEDNFRYDLGMYGWYDSYVDVDKFRTELIANYKERGWDIHYVQDFYFKDEEYN